MQNKEYHILNKPYAPDAYAKEVARIRAELLRSGQHNLRAFFASPYEEFRLRHETDSVIQVTPPLLSPSSL